MYVALHCIFFMKGRTSAFDSQTCQADRILRNLVHVPRRDEKTVWVCMCPSRVRTVVRCLVWTGVQSKSSKKVQFQRESRRRLSMRSHLRWDRPLPRQLTQGRFKCATPLGRRNNTFSHNQNQLESLPSTYIYTSHPRAKFSLKCVSPHTIVDGLVWFWYILLLCPVGCSICAFHLCAESSLESASTRNWTPRRHVNFKLQIQVKSREIPLDSLCFLWGERSKAQSKDVVKIVSDTVIAD